MRAQDRPAAAQPTEGVWLTTKHYWVRSALGVAVFLAIIAIFFSPLALEPIARIHRNWTLLGNIGQAYGGISTVISAVALVGVVASLLIQRRQHSLDRIAAIEGRQTHLYSVVRQEPELYWHILGFGPDSERDVVLLRIFRVEWLRYCAAGYNSGLISEINLRNEVFRDFFRYEENRQ